jgi:predicted nucleic acid-binding protein
MTAGADAFVIDASIALSWCFEDEASPAAEAVLQRLRQARAIAPALWPLDVANGLRSAERRGRIDERSIPLATQLLTALPVQIDDAVPLDAAMGRILSMARSVGLTAYDAAYLDLAARRGLPFATADDQLARAAVAAGVELMEAT